MRDAYRIILVEDEPALAELLRRLILKAYPTAAIEMYISGLEALEAYDRGGADMLLIDRGVPGMDGIALTRTIRARGDGVAIIGMSGDPSYREAYLAAGATEFIGGSALYDGIKALLRRFLPPPGQP